MFRHAQNKNLRLEPHNLSGRVGDMLRHRLGPWFASQTRPVLTERVVEYPWLFRNLPPAPARVLDFGAYEDLLPLHLASLGYDVVARDLRGYPFSHARLEVDDRDIFEGVEPASVDVVVSISTIEHVGLPGGGALTDDGDRRAVEIALQALKPGGTLLATVPFGRASEAPGFRVYDRERLRRVFPYERLDVFAKQGLYGGWDEADPAAAETISYGRGYAPVEAVACVICRGTSAPTARG